MQTLSLPEEYSPLHCTAPDKGRLAHNAFRLEIRGDPYTIGADLLARAAGLSVSALFEGGMVALGLHSRDLAPLGPAGFDDAWARRYRAHIAGMMKLWQRERILDHTAAAMRWVHGGPSAQDEARELVREIRRLAQPAGLREELSFVSADLQSFSGVRDALWEVAAKVAVPEFREALLGRGLRPERLARIDPLCDALFEERSVQLEWQGRQAGTTDVLQVLKAMALGDLTLLSQTARAHLPQERWERYQLGRLLGVPARERRDAPPLPDPEGPMPTTPAAAAPPRGRGPDGPRPGAAAPAGHGAVHAAGARGAAGLRGHAAGRLHRLGRGARRRRRVAAARAGGGHAVAGRARAGREAAPARPPAPHPTALTPRPEEPRRGIEHERQGRQAADGKRSTKPGRPITAW